MELISSIYLNHAAVQPNLSPVEKAGRIAWPPTKGFPMRFNILTIAAAIGIVVSSPGLAGSLKPIQNQAINLGGVEGDAYYTVRSDGFHVVATFAPRDGTETPVRFQAVLANGQAVSFSSPRGVGEQPVSVSIKRQGERVTVEQAALID
jgi:hypothetical protein